MIRQSTCTGRTFSTSSIQREVIQAQGHSGSNQNGTSSSDCDFDCSATSTATAPLISVFPLIPTLACGLFFLICSLRVSCSTKSIGFNELGSHEVHRRQPDHPAARPDHRQGHVDHRP